MTPGMLQALAHATRELVAEWPEDIRQRFKGAVRANRAVGLVAYQSLRDAYNQTWTEWQAEGGRNG